MTVYKDLAQFISSEPVEKVKGKQPLIVLKYKKPNYQDPSKEFTATQWESKLDIEVLERILNLSAGDKFCVHIEKQGNNYNLKDVTDASDAPTKTTQNTKYNKGGYSKKGSDHGAQAGNALKCACDTLKPGCSVDDIIARAIEIVQKTPQIIQAIKATEASSTTDSEASVSKYEQLKAKKAAQSKKTKSKVEDTEELEEAADLMDDDLDDVNFDD